MEHRFRRWLDNPRIDVNGLFGYLLQAILTPAMDQRVLVALDTQARHDFSRKLKWGPSDFSSEK